MESILTSIKKLLGIEETYEQFDVDIIIHINAALMVLNQLGVGATGFHITGKEKTWKDFLDEAVDLLPIQPFVYMSVRLSFDPPQNSFLVDAMKKQLDEMTWRLNLQAEAEPWKHLFTKPETE